MASKPSRWLPGLRALLTIGRKLGDIGQQLKRIADHLEGVTPVVDSPPDRFDRPEVLDPVNFAEVAMTEATLRRQLGRDPTPEEIVAAYDQREPDEWPSLRRQGEPG